MKDFKTIRKHRRILKMGRAISRKAGWLTKFLAWLGNKLRFLRVLRAINPLRHIKRLDWYIIKKFVGYYFFSIALIISIAIVFDFNEKLAKFTEYHAPAKAIIFDYYANFVPYSPICLAHCSYLWRSSSSPQKWQATLRLSPSWHQASLSNASCVLTSSPA